MTDEHLKEIGRVAVNFSSLEIHLTFFTWGLISEDQATGQAITTGMSFNSISNMFASLCKIKVTEPIALKEFEDITKKINDINVRRNQIIHSFWATDDNNKSKVSRIKFKADGFKGLKHIHEDITSLDIKKLADEIKTVTEELMKLALKHKK